MTLEPTMQALAGLSGIAPRYDVVLSDIWGVVHNGVAATRLPSTPWSTIAAMAAASC